MNSQVISALRKLCGTEELSDKDVKYRIIRSCAGIAMVVCIAYGAYSIPKNELLEVQKAAAESPRLVTLAAKTKKPLR